MLTSKKKILGNIVHIEFHREYICVLTTHLIALVRDDIIETIELSGIRDFEIKDGMKIH